MDIMDHLLRVILFLLYFSKNVQSLSLQRLGSRASVDKNSSGLYVPSCWASPRDSLPQGRVPYDVQTRVPPVQYLNTSATDIVWGPQVNVTCTTGEKKSIFLNSSHLYVDDGKVMLGWKIGRNSGDTYTYCVNSLATTEASENGPTYTALFCYTDPCKSRVCVEKCCPRGKLLGEHGCITNNLNLSDWVPNFHDHYDEPFYVNNINVEEVQVPLQMEEFTLEKNGSLTAFVSAPPRGFCIDHSSMNGMVTEVAIVYGGDISDYPDCLWKTQVLDIILLSVSNIFLALTLSVYLCVPHIRSKDHHWPLICMLLSLLVTFILHICLRKVRHQLDAMCRHFGMLVLMFTLATFFWLNVMSFSVWYKLRYPRLSTMGRRTFALFNVYAWGVPLIVYGVGYAMDALAPGDYSPNFKKEHCWFEGHNTAKWMYYYGFIAVIQVVNIFFFLHIACRMALWQKRKPSSHTTQRRTCVLPPLYVNLAIVMGIAWTLELFSDANTCGPVQVLIDVITGLHGPIIFVVTVCNRNKWKELRSRVTTSLRKITRDSKL
ncbi:G-protein coupled receptor Mth-like [Penaeus chinensis]|uniref:G-protein coupled receptor Mth-like n=1 Tax=Penaeus chinensis TaxID=139456 RepID=UPI001FB649EB|nr:G-protein coupled receptor Mth-like [Penaeus chinensis]